MAGNQDLLPNKDILCGIFPDLPDPNIDTCTVIASTPDTCTFRLRLAAAPGPGYPTDLVVRLQKAGSGILAVTDLQRLAHLQLPDVVPETLAVGSVSNSTGEELGYSVSPFVDGTVTLEDVWYDLGLDNLRYLMDAIVDSIKRVQQLDYQKLEDCQSSALFISKHDFPSGENVIGGPHTGYHATVKPLLEGLLRDENTCEIKSIEGGMSIRSVYQDIGSVELSQEDLQVLGESVVLCHNDLEPRNILVKQGDKPGHAPWYDLAAIIDWEMAGFYPFSYEFGLKDNLLGTSNLYLGWYSLFKERAASLVPEGEAHDKLIKALGIIYRSNEMVMKRNVGARVRAKWIERQRLTLSPDVRRGWVREEGADNAPTLTREDTSNLELEVLKELGYI